MESRMRRMSSPSSSSIRFNRSLHLSFTPRFITSSYHFTFKFQFHTTANHNLNLNRINPNPVKIQSISSQRQWIHQQQQTASKSKYRHLNSTIIINSNLWPPCNLYTFFTRPFHSLPIRYFSSKPESSPPSPFSSSPSSTSSSSSSSRAMRRRPSDRVFIPSPAPPPPASPLHALFPWLPDNVRSSLFSRHSFPSSSTSPSLPSAFTGFYGHGNRAVDHWLFLSPSPTRLELSRVERFSYVCFELGIILLAMGVVSGIMASVVAPVLELGMKEWGLDSVMANRIGGIALFSLMAIVYASIVRIWNRVSIGIIPPVTDKNAKSAYSAFFNRFVRPAGSRNIFLVAASLVIGLQLFTFVSQILIPSGTHREATSLIIQAYQRDWTTLAFLAVCAPVLEEVLFRGIFFARLTRFVGVGSAYLVSSLVFGMLHHSEESVKTIDCIIGGSAMALAYRMTNTLYTPILMHMVNNAGAVLSYWMFSPLEEDEKVRRDRLRWGTNWEIQQERIVYGCKIALARLRGIFSFKSATSPSPTAPSSSSPSSTSPAPTSAPKPVVQLNSRAERTWNFFASIAASFRVPPSLSSAQASLLSSTLFNILDRDQKGYLTSEEFSYWMMMDWLQIDWIGCAAVVLKDKNQKEEELDYAKPKKLQLDAFFFPNFLQPSSWSSSSSSLSALDSLVSPYTSYIPSTWESNSHRSIQSLLSTPPTASSSSSSSSPARPLSQSELARLHNLSAFHSYYKSSRDALIYTGLLQEWNKEDDMREEKQWGKRKISREEFEEEVKRVAVLDVKRLMTATRLLTLIVKGEAKHPLEIKQNDDAEEQKNGAAGRTSTTSNGAPDAAVMAVAAVVVA